MNLVNFAAQFRDLGLGAVCGNWWKGAQKGCPEGFALFELHNEGTFSVEYRPYGWKAAG